MKVSLNFSWKFVPNFEDEYLTKLPENAIDVDLPHNAFEIPYNYFSEKDYQNVVTYEKVFEYWQSIFHWTEPFFDLSTNDNVRFDYDFIEANIKRLNLNHLKNKIKPNSL